MFGDPDGDPLGGFPDRVAVEMRIARGRLGLAVTEQPADDRQPLAERERPRGEGVAKVVNSQVLQSALAPMRRQGICRSVMWKRRTMPAMT